MASDPQALRRRAATLVLAPLVDDAMLLEALRLVTEWRDDSVPQIINYVDRVAQHARFDAVTCKRLYAELHRAIRAPEDALPLDPFPELSAVRATRPVEAPRAAARPPIASATLHPPAEHGPQPVADAAPVVPEQAIFAAVMRAIVAELVQQYQGSLGEVREEAIAELARTRSIGGLRSAAEAAFTALEDDRWRIDAPAAELAELVHVFYVALCRAIGPIEADRLLTQGIEAAARLPEARTFPPHRLL